MKKKFLLFTLVGGISVVALSSYHSGPAAANAYDCTGAEAGGSGSYANPVGCTGGGCHSSSATTAISVLIELDSVGISVPSYKPGVTYTVKLTSTYTGGSLNKYGFQLAAMKGTTTAATVSDAGTWSTSVPTGTHVAPPATGNYLSCAEQSNTMTTTGSTFTQSFTWTAPVAGTGTISFWAAANFVNGDGNANTADKWNTNHITINELSTVSVPNVVNNIDVNIFPNPIANSMNVAIGNVAAGNYEVCVFDLNGKMVACSSFVATGSAQNTSINTANLVAGVYNVVISNGNDKKVVSVVKQ